MNAPLRETGRDALGQFRPARILLPLALSLGMVAWLFYQEFSKKGLTPGDLLTHLPWTSTTLGGLALALGMLVLREFGYMWQLRILADGKIGWLPAFEIVMLWNFFAAVSPSMVGGAAVAVYMLGKEGIGVGRATAIVFTVVYFDQVFYISVPLLVSLVIPQSDIFAPMERIPIEWLGTSLYGAFWSAWGGLALYVVLLIGALFIAPAWIHWWLARLLGLPILRRWRIQGLHVANELLIASRDLRDRSFVWWIKAWVATSLAWSGRYLVLNCVLAAFSPTPFSLFDHLLVLGRQAVLWVIMAISPTPGSAGIAELAFSWLFRDLLPPGLVFTLAILWRLISYYPYLIFGAPIMTRWLRRVCERDVR